MYSIGTATALYCTAAAFSVLLQQGSPIEASFFLCAASTALCSHSINQLTACSIGTATCSIAVAPDSTIEAPHNTDMTLLHHASTIAVLPCRIAALPSSTAACHCSNLLQYYCNVSKDCSSLSNAAFLAGTVCFSPSRYAAAPTALLLILSMPEF